MTFFYSGDFVHRWWAINLWKLINIVAHVIRMRIEQDSNHTDMLEAKNVVKNIFIKPLNIEYARVYVLIYFRNTLYTILYIKFSVDS